MYNQTHTLPKTLSSFAWHFLKKEWKWVVLIQIFSFAWSLDHTMWPYIIMVFIDAITNYVGDRAQVWHVLAWPIFTGLGLWIVLECFYRASGILLARIIPKIEADIRMSMYDYVQHHSHQYFSNKMAGSIANKISDMPQSFTRVFQAIIQLFLPVLLAIVISVVLFARINPIFGVLLGGWVIVHMATCLFFARPCDEASSVHAESRSILSGKIVDCLTNSVNVRLFSRHRFETSYLQKYQKDEKEKQWTSLWYIEKMKIYLGLVCFLGNCIALNWYMIYQWQLGLLTAGEVIFIFNTSWNITMMSWLAGLELPQLFKEIGVCRQALTIVEDPHDMVDIPSASNLKVTRGEIKFENVTFHYHKEANLFKNKNITIPAGQKVGLVGFSGSGKTTFVNLILRYYNLEGGRILIDNQDISKLTQSSLREHIAVIPQDPSLFHRSLMENIRYGRLDANDEEIIEASKKAHCHEFVEKMPEKYDSLVGERGIKLSGGQRQRIAIARAFLKKAPILILDEATSSLDSVTEKKIQSGLNLLMKDLTTIIIAHRLSTLSDMDRILVFKEGQIIEDGTHSELMQEDGHYAKMWEMQAGGFLPEEEQ